MGEREYNTFVWTHSYTRYNINTSNNLIVWCVCLCVFVSVSTDCVILKLMLGILHRTSDAQLSYKSIRKSKSWCFVKLCLAVWRLAPHLNNNNNNNNDNGNNNGDDDTNNNHKNTYWKRISLLFELVVNWRCCYCYCAIIALIVCVILILSHSIHPSIHRNKYTHKQTHTNRIGAYAKDAKFFGAFTDILLPYFLSFSSSSILFVPSIPPTLYLAKRGKFDFAICRKFHRKPIYPNKQNLHCHLIYCFLWHKSP